MHARPLLAPLTRILLRQSVMSICYYSFAVVSVARALTTGHTRAQDALASLNGDSSTVLPSRCGTYYRSPACRYCRSTFTMNCGQGAVTAPRRHPYQHFLHHIAPPARTNTGPNALHFETRACILNPSVDSSRQSRV